MMTPMRLFFFLGLSLLGLAFFASAAEVVSHAMPGDKRDFIVPAYDLWYALWPKSLLITEIRVVRIAPWLWDPVLVTLLKLPGWAIFGIPGGMLAWFARPNRGATDPDEIDEVLASFDLYDELTREAAKVNPPDEEHGPTDIHPDDTPIDDHDDAPLEFPHKRE